MTADEIQHAITRNVRVLMAMRGITTKRALAELLGKPENHLSRQLNDQRRWQLEDLADIAAAFEVTPDSLLGDVTYLVGAAGPVSVGTGRGSNSVTDQYASPNRRKINGG
ncbi:helix-turn-helix domain-containing protein [Alloactinosynnema sp. L-07]|uniref:helix-turn-helix domain-containing protein n=1 Tax=Alloactinosynnema sp. L-07 TaxID=1653480 RepID=UPI0015614AA4|nr:helix-turn-helix transcriptional regulator [Alloactinosynnema sp. L-07]